MYVLGFLDFQYLVTFLVTKAKNFKNWKFGKVLYKDFNSRAEVYFRFII